MSWIALRMLMGDRAKYFGLIFGVSFATMTTLNVELIHGTLTPQHVALEATKLPRPGMACHPENSLTGK